jgi:C1A family cysteine protease
MKLDKYSIYILIIVAIVGTVALVGSISNTDLAGEAIKKVERASLEDQVLSKQASLGEAFSIASTEVSRININQMFSNDGDEYSLDIDYAIYGLTVSADIDLQGDASLVRIVLVDSNQNEYLVYEAYPRIADDTSFTIEDVCEETCVLDEITPSLLKLEIEEGSSIDITDVSFTDSKEKLKVKTSSIPNEAIRLKGLQDDYKIQKINNKELGWTAGETSVSRHTFAEKKLLFEGNSLPNLQGIEYYKEGVFELKSNKEGNNRKTKNNAESTIINYGDLVDSFDWRDAHGENWMTPAKEQSPTGHCGSCAIFTAIASIEANINIYYNDPSIDMILSEQEPVCYVDDGCGGAQAYNTLAYVRKEGVADEDCIGYCDYLYEVMKCCEWYDPEAWDSWVCDDVDSRRWGIESFNAILQTGDILEEDDYILEYLDDPNVIILEDDISEEVLLESLIEKGPTGVAIPSWNHEVLFIGFDSMSVGNLFEIRIWNFKNSWGDNWGDNGFGSIILDMESIESIVTPYHPYLISNPEQYQINCEDGDGDGYCWWGLAEGMPDSCPDNCGNGRDFDDSDPSIGTLDPDSGLGCHDPDKVYAEDGRDTQSTVTIAGMEYTDSCYDPDGDGVTVDLIEYSCTDEPEGLLDILHLDCDFTCEIGEGRCINVEGCDDPDANDLNGGIHTQSTTTIGTETATPFEVEDHCDINNPDVLVEGICGGFGFDLIECEFGCLDGVCLRNFGVETQGNAVEANQENIETCSFDSPLQCDYRRINPTSFIMTIENIGATSFTITRVNQYFMDAVAGQNADCPVLSGLDIALSPGEETDIIVPCEILEKYIGIPVKMDLEIMSRTPIGKLQTIDGSIWGVVGN